MSDVDDDDTSSIDAATSPGASGGVTLAPLTRDPWMVIFRLSVGGELISDFSSHRCATNQSPMSVGRSVGWLDDWGGSKPNSPGGGGLSLFAGVVIMRQCSFSVLIAEAMWHTQSASQQPEW